MKLELGLTHKGIILVLVPLVFGLLSVAILQRLLSQTESELANFYKQIDLTTKVEDLEREFSAAGFSLGGYAQTGNGWFKDGYQAHLRRAHEDLQFLSSSIHDRNVSVELESFTSKVNAGLAALETEQLSLESENLFLRQYTSADVYRKVRLTSGDVQLAGDKLLAVLHSHSGTKKDIQESGRQRLQTYTTLLSTFNVLLTVFLSVFFTQSIKKRINHVGENSLRLANGQALHPILSGTDEIAKLDRTFHRVSAQLTEMIRRERAIMENAVDVICTISSTGRILSISDSVESWGYTAEQLTGSHFILLVADDDRETKLRSLNSNMEPEALTSIDAVILKKDRTRRFTNWSISWSARDLAFFCVIHDITDQRAIEKLRDEFFTMVTHDLRTPLSSVEIFLEMLRSAMLGELSAEGQKGLIRADASMKHVLDLVNDLLDYDKIHAGEMVLDLQELDLIPLIRESIDAVTPFADKHKVSIYFTNHGEVSIAADRERLMRVMVNLLSNAIKFSPSQQVVSVNLDTSADHVVIKVVDLGPGIPGQDQSKIFEKYKQTSVRSTYKVKSTGLGLPICKAIISAHQGEIGVESESGKGSTFWFTLPLVKDRNESST